MNPLRHFASLILFFAAAGLISPTFAASSVETPASRSWNQIKDWFVPPPEWATNSATYRSPLLKPDGTRITTPKQWELKRKELLADWHRILGPWPEILQKPTITLIRREIRDGITFERIQLQIAPGPGQTGEAWLLRPAGSGPFPAALVVYYEPETSVGLGREPLRDFGLQLARRGFVTLSIGTPGGNAWKPDLGNALCQPLSFHAYVAANCWQALAGDPQVDKRRIGVLGHSYGGKWAMFAAAMWEKFACVAVSDPGIVFDESRPNVNYWEPWYLGLDPNKQRPARGIPSTANPRTGPYKLLFESGRDLHEIHALICPRPFFVSGGAEDPPSRWAALNHSREINALLPGRPVRVGMDHRPNHAPTAESNERIYAFFEWALKDLPAAAGR